MSLDNCCVPHSLVDARISLISHEEVERGVDKALKFDLTWGYYIFMRRFESNYPKVYSVLRVVGLNSFL